MSFLPNQGRFADALLKELAGVTIPPERIYGLGTGLVYISCAVKKCWCFTLLPWLLLEKDVALDFNGHLQS